jgi:hypothetical protein
VEQIIGVEELWVTAPHVGLSIPNVIRLANSYLESRLYAEHNDNQASSSYLRQMYSMTLIPVITLYQLQKLYNILPVENKDEIRKFCKILKGALVN